MFGGTPANLAVTFVSEHVEVITGVNLPMLIKLARAAEAGRAGGGGARDAGTWTKRHLGGVGPVERRESVTRSAVTILNPLGLHARAAARFVHAASAFTCRIRVGRGGREVDGKSIMGLLLLAASRGSEIIISADGPDEEAAVAALCALIERGLDEAPCV